MTKKSGKRPVKSKTKVTKSARGRKGDIVLSDAEKEHMLDERRQALLAKAAKGPNARYVKLLLNLRDRLLDDIEFHASDNLKRTQKDASSDLSAYSVHMADAGTDNFDREFALSMVSNEQEALYEINEALKRLENGTFGICESCGQEIGFKRLKARPVTTLCIDCKTQQEAEEKIREA